MDADPLTTAQEEWEAVPSVTIASQNFAGQYQSQVCEGAPLPLVPTVDQSKPVLSPVISANHAVQHFRSHPSLTSHKVSAASMKTLKRNIKPILQYAGMRACLHILFGPPNLCPQLKDDRDLLFAMAVWQFDNEEPIHTQMLLTIYKLTSPKFDPPRFGHHWDDIGFQGTDPATDLRGGGCLGLINLVYLTTEIELRELCHSIYTLSRHPVQNFPFSVMSLNITRIALQALRGQLLNKEANKSRDIVRTFNDFYVASFLHLYLLWKDGYKTIHDSGYVVKETETYCCKNVSSALKRLTSFLAEQNKGRGVAEEPVRGFTDIERIISRS